jgi:uncharacterized protein YndB with AHSA1/START domain
MTGADCVLVALRVTATPERAFDAFTQEIGQWWRPDPLFRITPWGDGTLAFEGGEGGRLVSRLDNGKTFEIGRVTAWARGVRLAFDWRQATFPRGLNTRVEVTFEAIADETRVTVRHFGWTALPREQAARHGFPDAITQQRVADWWRRSLAAIAERH